MTNDKADEAAPTVQQSPWEPERANNFDALRFALAALVIFAHSWPLLWGIEAEAYEPLKWLTRGQLHFGTVAVSGFFLLSGFLITASWTRKPALGAFAAKRARRIYPGYAAAAVLVWLAFAPVFMALPGGGVAPAVPGSGLASPGSTPQAWAAGLLRAEPLWQIVSLRIVKAGALNNGSTWTVAYEALCYVAVAALGVCGLLKSNRRLRLTTGALCGALFLFRLGETIYYGLGVTPYWVWWEPVPEPAWIRGGAWVSVVLPSPAPGTWISLFACFWTGAAFYAWRERIPRRASLAALCLVLLVPLTLAGRLGEWLPFALAYPLFYAAFAPGPLNDWKRNIGGDYSYGVYLYGTPVQFLLAAWVGAYLNPLTFFALALPLATACAVLSWRLVEAPFLARKTKRTPVPAPPPMQPAKV